MDKLISVWFEMLWHFDTSTDAMWQEEEGDEEEEEGDAWVVLMQ